MDRIHFPDMSDYPPENSTLKRIFDLYAEETITDEQVERVLAPVRKMINEGKFNKPYRLSWLTQPLILTVSVVVMTVMVVMVQDKTTMSVFVDISGAEPPLAGVAPVKGTPTGCVTLTVKDTGGVKFTLVNIDSIEIYAPEITGGNGICIFEDIPNGTYRIMALPPSGSESVDAGTWVVADGKIQPISGGDSENLGEGVDVQVCPAE